MKQYLDLVQDILDNGHKKADRTGTGTLSVFGRQMRFDLSEGFPLVTTKKVHLRSIIHELLWFLSGDTNTKYLEENNVTIWREWQDENGDLGPVYGHQWREWENTKTVDISSLEKYLSDGWKIWDDAFWDMEEGRTSCLLRKKFDQIQTVVDQLRNDPDSRRIIVSAWNVGDLADMALAPCHAFFQFYTRELTVDEQIEWGKANLWESWDSLEEALREQLSMQDIDHDEAEECRMQWVEENVPKRVLSCQLYQRSCDCFLGLPFNIASYALLIHMVAQQVDMAVGEFVWTGGDTHLYLNHLEQAHTQLRRGPLPLPKLNLLRKPDSIFDYKFEDFEIEGYESHEAIKAPVAI